MSNSFVISGNHTKSGRAILSSDSYMGKGVPNFWVIQHLNFKILDPSDKT